ncbi:MAG: TIM barrel protein [Verrucomicrobiales bacterium]|nr:TIM barrel protein [Verrucomicrobiales bacterium]
MIQKIRPSVCIDSVFEGVALPEACRKVAEAQLPAIEFWSWWDKDLSELEDSVAENGLTISGCCTKFVSLVDPGLRESYLEGLAESREAAERLQAPILISQVGDFREGASREEQRECLIEGLREAAAVLEGSDQTLVIEPLNERIDHAGYFLIRSDEAFEIVRQVGSEKIQVVFDIYHQQISEGDVIRKFTENIDQIAHFHAAGNPGRHELQSGELHYPNIFSAIADTTYEGFVGLEYWPVDPDPVGALREAGSWFAKLNGGEK